MTANAALNTAAGATAAMRRAGRDADDGGDRPRPHHVVEADALGAMGEIGAERGRHDDRERGADAELHADVLGNPERAKHLVEHRNDDAAAADAEQAGEEAGEHAAAGNGGGQHREFREAARRTSGRARAGGAKGHSRRRAARPCAVRPAATTTERFAQHLGAGTGLHAIGGEDVDGSARAPGTAVEQPEHVAQDGSCARAPAATSRSI